MLSCLAMIFLTLAGYSAGAVLGSWTRRGGQKGGSSPSLLDTAMVVVMWISGIALLLTVLEPWAAVGIWLILAMGVAFLLKRLQVQPDEGKPLPQ